MNSKIRRSLLTACVCLFLVSLAFTGIFSASLRAQTPNPARQSTERHQPKEFQNINQDLVRAILSNPKASSSDLDRVLTQADRQEIQDAIKELTDSIKADSTDGTVYYALGQLYYIEGDYKAAIENFDRAIKLSNHQDDLAYYSGGLSYYRINDISTATKYIEKAIDLDLEGWLDWLRNQRRDPKPADAAGKFNAGYKNYQQGDQRGGRISLREAEDFFCTRAKPNYPRICRQVQTCMCSLGIKRTGCPSGNIGCRNIDAKKLS